MPVRVSKPEFNLRDKISHLDIPVGSHGGQLIKSSNPDETFELVGTGRRNVMVNGAMRFNQRGAASYDAPAYTLDRWRYHRSSDGEFDIKPSTVAPPGFSNSLHVDCKVASQTVSNGSYSRIRYFVEGHDCQRFGKGTSNPKNFCLSFYVKSNVLGNYSVNLQATSRVITRNYKVTDTDWNRYVIVFPNEDVNPISDNSNAGLEIQFGLCHGTNYTGGEGRDGWTAHAVNKEHTGSDAKLWSSTNNNLYLTGVQLEAGDVATPFEHLTYKEDLARCQRYCVAYGDDDEVHLGIGVAYNSTNINLSISTPVTMRAQPAVSKTTSGGNWLQSYKGATGQNSNASVEVGEKVNNNVRIYCQTTGHSSLSTGDGLWCQVLPNAKLILNAEM